MEDRRRLSIARLAARWLSPVLITLAAFFPAHADETYRETFESRQTGWLPATSGLRPTVIAHERIDGYGHNGGRCEFLRFEAAQPLLDRYTIDLPIPAARFHPEAAASIMYWSSQSGAELSLKLVFPHQIDPETGKPLEGVLGGTVYETTNQWQQLTSAISEEGMRQLVQRLHAQLGAAGIPVTEHALQDPAIVGVTLHVEILAGRTDVLIDDLELAHYVPDSTIQSSGLAREVSRLELGDDRVLLEDRPTILRFTPYHGESLDLLEESAFNLIWLRDLGDESLLAALEDSNLHGIVAPPLSLNDVTTVSGTADPAPFDDRTAPIVMFNLGQGITAGEEQIHELARRANLVRTADIHFQRQLMADVQGNVREFHRNVDFVGFRWDILHTEAPPSRFAAFLEERRRQALPGKPTYTWVASEPVPALLEAGQAASAFPCVECEQIFWQGYTAMGAGCKGIGFFKHIPFDDPSPGTEERRLAITLLNMHIRLLERWLATGKPSGAATVQFGDDAPRDESLPYWVGPLTSRYDPVRSESAQSAAPPTPEATAGLEVKASLIDSDYGRLVLLNWHHPDMCFQPGRMHAENVRVLVPGDWTQGWLITTTCVHPFPLELRRVGGGTEVRLDELNQFAAVVLTADHRVIEAVVHEMRADQADAADAWVELAACKWERVAQVHGELAGMTSVSHRGDSILAAARTLIDRGRLEWDSGNYDESRRLAEEALMWLRMLQHEDWRQIAGDSNWGPASTAFSCGFQSLPQHVRLRDAYISAAERSENLLTTGSFDDYNSFRAAGWGVTTGESTQQGWRASFVPSQLVPGYVLRVEAATVAQSDGNRPAVVVESPGVRVELGQIVAITGRIRITMLSPSLQAGVVLSDSELGPSGGRRWFAATDGGEWEEFTLLRRISRTGELSLRLELHGAGQLEIDDVQIVAIDSAP